MNCYVLRVISWALVVCLASGCSSRRIYFTSNPSGALASAGGASCTTPCYLNVPAHTQKAVFALYSGVNTEVAISDLTSRSAAAQYGVEKTGEYTLYSLAMPFLVIGGLAALAVAILYQSDTIETEHSSREETIFIIVGATGLVTGGALAFLGQTISESANDVKPEVYVKLEKPQHFPLLTNPTSTQHYLQYDGKTKPLKLFPDIDSSGNMYWK